MRRLLLCCLAIFFGQIKNNILRGCNNLQAKDLGYARKDIIGKSIYDLVSKEMADRHADINNRVLATGIACTEEEYTMFGYPHPATSLTSKVPLYDGEKIIGVLGVSLDITELKRTQDALQTALKQAQVATQAKSQFITNMSHDIRTPLAGMIGLAELLVATQPTTTIREYGEMIKASAEQLLSLLNNILDIIALEHSEAATIKQETFDLRQLSHQLHELILPSVTAKGLQFHVTIDPQLPLYIVSDRLKLERILLNLTTNAIKFTEQGQITLSIQVLAHKKHNIQLAISLTDTGIGIAEDKRQYIFEQFFKAHPSYEGNYKGYGVGLYLVKQFVDLLGGHITVQSELHRGTTFTVTLWVLISAAKESPSTAHATTCFTSEGLQASLPEQTTRELTTIAATPPVSVSSSHRSDHILFIDDEATIQLMIQRLLTQAGYQVTLARDAKTAWQYLQDHHFNLILTDIGLPDGSGIEIASAYRVLEQKTHRARIPIVALTGHGTVVQADCLAAGIDQVWAKGKACTSLLHDIQVLLNHRSHHGVQNKTVVSHAIKKKAPCFDPLIAEANFGKEIIAMLTMWLAGSAQSCSSLTAAAAENNWEKIKYCAHKLKGSSIYVGAIQLYTLCAKLEENIVIPLSNETQCHTLLQQVISCLKQTEHMMKAWLKKPYHN